MENKTSKKESLYLLNALAKLHCDPRTYRVESELLVFLLSTVKWSAALLISKSYMQQSQLDGGKHNLKDADCPLLSPLFRLVGEAKSQLHYTNHVVKKLFILKRCFVKDNNVIAEDKTVHKRQLCPRAQTPAGEGGRHHCKSPLFDYTFHFTTTSLYNLITILFGSFYHS